MEPREQKPNLQSGDRAARGVVARLLCRLGLHDWGVVDVTFGFGPGGSVETVECRRCGNRKTRAGVST